MANSLRNERLDVVVTITLTTSFERHHVVQMSSNGNKCALIDITGTSRLNTGPGRARMGRVPDS